MVALSSYCCLMNLAKAWNRPLTVRKCWLFIICVHSERKSCSSQTKIIYFSFICDCFRKHFAFFISNFYRSDDKFSKFDQIFIKNSAFKLIFKNLCHISIFYNEKENKSRYTNKKLIYFLKNDSKMSKWLISELNPKQADERK